MKKRAVALRSTRLSFVAVAVAVQLSALQVSSRVADARDLHPEAVHAPADPPFTTTGRLTLQAQSVLDDFLQHFIAMALYYDHKMLRTDQSTLVKKRQVHFSCTLVSFS